MKRKDSILANFYYQSLPKGKEGGNYFQKYRTPQNNTPEYRVDPKLKFYDKGGEDKPKPKREYKTLPEVLVYSSYSNKQNTPTPTFFGYKQEPPKDKSVTLPEVKVEAPTKRTTPINLTFPKKFVPPVVDLPKRKTIVNPEVNQMLSGFTNGIPTFDIAPARVQTTVPYSSQNIDIPLINTGRKPLNSQAQAAAMMQLMNMSNGLIGDNDSYIAMLEQADPERAALYRFMQRNPFKEKFFNGGFLMPAQEGGNINFPNQRGYTPQRMANGGDISIPDLRKDNWLRKYDDGGPKDPPPGAAEKQFIVNWNNSPMAQEMLQASVDKDDPWGRNSAYVEDITNARNDLASRAQISFLPQDELIKKGNDSNIGTNTAGFNTNVSKSPIKEIGSIIGNMFLTPGVINTIAGGKDAYSTVDLVSHKQIQPEIYVGTQNEKESIPSIIVHETSHGSDLGGALIPPSDKDKIDRYARGVKGAPNAVLNRFQTYVAEPTETRARLNNFRMNAKNQKLYDPFTQKVTIDNLRKYKASNDGLDPLDQLREVYTDYEIVDMLNSISAADPMGKRNSDMAKYGGWLTKYDPGGPTPKKKLTQEYPWLNTNPLGRNVSESTSFGAIPMRRNAEMITNQRNQDNAAIANYKKTNPWASNKSDSEILGLIDINKKNIQNQATVRQAAPKRSTASKTWAIASNPMTALKYKVHGQDIPDYFERGDRNHLDIAMDVINPATYINAGGRTLENISQPLTTSKRLLSGVGQLAANAVGDKAGWDNVLDAAGIVGDAATIIPVGRGVTAVADELKPFVQQAKKTYDLTADLPRATRIRNALNAGTTKYHLRGIDNSEYTHHVFGSHMTPEEALGEIRSQKLTAPRGALMGDASMSLNSTPLYFQSAARDAKNFPVVRTGDFQRINSMGFKGKKISQSIPERLYTEHPEVIQRYNAEVSQINDDVNNLMNSLNDPSLSPAERARQMARIEETRKLRLSQIAPEKEAIAFMNQNPELFSEFYTAYKPHLDRPITVLNEATGLNFPRTKGYFGQYGPTWEAPTAYSVKGSFAPRYSGIAKKAGNEFLDNSKIKTFVRQNDQAFKSYSNELTDINQGFNNRINELQSAYDRGVIDDVMYGEAMDDAGRIRDMRMRVFRNNYPSGRPAITESSIDLTPKHFAIPGILNKQFGKDKANAEVEKGLWNTFLNAGSYRNAKLKKYGGQSLVGKYPFGGPISNVAAPLPTPQTGSSNQYGPTFSNQTGYTPPEDKRDKFRDTALNLLKLGVFMGGLFPSKKKEESAKEEETKKKNVTNNPNDLNKQLTVDGNGKPLADITWNYNPAMKAQELNNPFLQQENPGGGLYESNTMMARHGGDVSIYGRRNYRADTPSFYNFGGMINGMNINNNSNWLKKYKS